MPKANLCTYACFKILPRMYKNLSEHVVSIIVTLSLILLLNELIVEEMRKYCVCIIISEYLIVNFKEYSIS